MKNWELKQFLHRVQCEFVLGKDKIYFFRRTTERSDYYIDRSAYHIIDEAIAYIKELEAKVEELSYAQKIIDEVNKHGKDYSSRRSHASNP